MTQVLSTTSFYSHSWSDNQFGKRRNNWFEKIRHSEYLNKKKSSIFPSLIYSRQPTNLNKSPIDVEIKCMLDNTGSTSSKEEASNKTIESCTSSETTLIHTLSNHSKYTEISNTVKKSSNYLSKKPQPKHNKSHSIFQSPSSSPKLDHSSAGISVPTWCVDLYTGRYVIEGTEDLSDNVFLSRHERLEIAEKKRKKRDERFLKEHEKLYRLKQLNNPVDDNLSVRYIEVVEKEPKCAFGKVIPDLPLRDFKLPSSFFTLARHEHLRNYKTNTTNSKKKTS